MKKLILALSLIFTASTFATDFQEDLTCQFKMISGTKVIDTAIKFVAEEEALYVATEDENGEFTTWDVYREEFSFKKIAEFPYTVYQGTISGGAAAPTQILTITVDYPVYNFEDKKTYRVLGMLVPSFTPAGLCESESFPAK